MEGGVNGLLGYIMMQQAATTKNSHDKRYFLSEAVFRFQEALAYNPNNKDCLLASAEAVSNLYRYSKAQDRDPNMLKQAEGFYDRAMQNDPNDPHILFKYADFLCYSKKHERACDFFLRSLEKDPNQISCLRRFGDFVAKIQHDVVSSEKLYARALKIKPEDISNVNPSPATKNLTWSGSNSSQFSQIANSSISFLLMDDDEYT
jgi:tetratricopeptide (TPR) repeat protein